MPEVMSQEEFVDSQGLQCPYCLAFATILINGEYSSGSDDLANQIQCNMCGKTWWELLKVVGWEPEEVE